jgi:hypothetical protein
MGQVLCRSKSRSAQASGFISLAAKNAMAREGSPTEATLPFFSELQIQVLPPFRMLIIDYPNTLHDALIADCEVVRTCNDGQKLVFVFPTKRTVLRGFWRCHA